MVAAGCSRTMLVQVGAPYSGPRVVAREAWRCNVGVLRKVRTVEMELLERFARGDGDAFEALFREYQRNVYTWIVRIVRDPAAAEDLTVEAFWRMYRAHARFDASRSFGGWARRIATNLALDHLQKMRRELPLLVEAAEEPAENPGVQREMREEIARAFEKLSPKLRVVATLGLVEEVPLREIADALGIPEVTARVRLWRAVKILRGELKHSMVGSEAKTETQRSPRTA
jgi:RNA polymerase sigma-70 factor, ECF subfamily